RPFSCAPDAKRPERICSGLHGCPWGGFPVYLTAASPCEQRQRTYNTAAVAVVQSIDQWSPTIRASPAVASQALTASSSATTESVMLLSEDVKVLCLACRAEIVVPGVLLPILRRASSSHETVSRQWQAGRR